MYHSERELPRRLSGYSLAGDQRPAPQRIFVEEAERSRARLPRVLGRAQSRRGSSAAEYKRIGEGGKEIWLRASHSPIFDPSSTALQGGEILHRHPRGGAGSRIRKAELQKEIDADLGHITRCFIAATGDEVAGAKFIHARPDEQTCRPSPQREELVSSRCGEISRRVDDASRISDKGWPRAPAPTIS